jgi:hypothetical protein
MTGDIKHQLPRAVHVADTFGHGMAAMSASAVIVATFGSATPFDQIMTYAVASVLILGSYLFAWAVTRR